MTYLSACGWNSTAGLVPKGHRILVYIDLDTLIFQEGRIQGMHLVIYFLLVCEPRFAEQGLGSATSRTSRRADKTSTSAIRIAIFSWSADNSSRHNDVI